MKSNTSARIASALIWLCILSTAHSAQITTELDSDFCSAATVRISGEIKKGDAARLEVLINQLTSYTTRIFGECTQTPMVILSSQGGNVDESLAMGRLIRSARLRSVVAYHTECASACVFLLAAGVDRENYGKVTIHRPYFNDIEKGKSIDEIRSDRVRQVGKIATYLENMDISRLLLDAMNAIPPDEVRVLTNSELHAYRLIGEDASYEEYSVNRAAKLFNLSTAEYRRRHLAAWDRCEKAYPSEPNICVNTLILGISISEGEARWGRLQICKGTTKNETTHDECFRKYMVLGEK